MRAWWPLLALAGCSFPDRPGPPFACAGAALPTTAPGTVQIHGNVTDPLHNEPVSGAMEIVHQFDKAITDASVVDTATIHTLTDSEGEFRASPMTNGVPLVGYVVSQQAGYLDTYAYPARPIASDFGVELIQLGGPQLGSLLCTGCPRIGDAICQACPPPPEPAPAPDTAVAHLIVSVVDCNDNAVPGATVMVTGGGSPVVYFLGAALRSDAISTDEKRGAALITGLSPGLVTIQASLGPESAGAPKFMPNTVLVTANALTFAEISP